MAIELKIPALGESITEVEIGDWLKHKGEPVQKDEPLVTLESEKATLELPAPDSGTLTEVLKEKGQTAAVGETIAYLDKDGIAQTTSEPAAAPAPAQTGPPVYPTRIKRHAEQAEAAPAAPAPVAAPRIAQHATEISAAPASPPHAAVPAGPTVPVPPRISPAAARLLAENGLRAQELKATGPGGLLLKEDVLAHLTEKKQQSENQPIKPPPSSAPKPALPPPRAPLPAGREEEVVPMTRLRRTLAERLVLAQQTAALLTTFNELDMSAVMALRKEYGEAFQQKYKIKLGFMSFFVKATVEALKLFPAVNAEIRENNIVYHNYYDIGIAIGGAKGLVVPVVRNAERMSFAEIELAIADFARRIKENRILPEELHGGTFTITNGGIYGSMLSTPIINPPQSGILGMHAIQDRPVAREGSVVIRPMMYVALTYDHRLVDGREAVSFLKRVKETIENPARLLIEV